MSRRPRLTFAGATYHVMSRGNRKSTIFHDDVDRYQFLRILGTAAVSYDLLISAACLMGNHYHLILEAPRCNLSEAMHFINSVFAQRSNRRHAQTGHVFEARFRSLVIQRESYLRRAARYIVRNPVRAKLVARPGDWAWSSYRATAGLEPAPDWLHVDWILWAFSVDSLDEARRRYVQYVDAPAALQRAIDLNAAVLGTTEFGKRLRAQVASDQDHGDRPVPRVIRALSRPPLPELFDGSRASVTARNRLIKVARVEHGYRLAEIARYLGIDPSTASKAASRRRGLTADHEPESS